MKSKITNHNQTVNLATLTTMIALTLLLSGCSSSLSNNGSGERLALLPADDMKQGPGIFSGSKGEFFIIGGDKKIAPQANTRPEPTYRPIKSMNLNETSKVLDDKIKQLEKDQIELELLKRELNKKLKAQ